MRWRFPILQTIIPIPESKKEILEENNIFQKITDKKIVAEYEEKLKDIKIELKKLIYEYNVLQQASEDLTDSKEAEEILHSKEFFEYIKLKGICASGNSFRITANDISEYRF